MLCLQEDTLKERRNVVIEKLGIKRILAHSTHRDGYTFFDYCEVRDLQIQRDKLLEALIKSEIMDEKLHGGNDFDNQKIIEKATGKTWQEIKELLK